MANTTARPMADYGEMYPALEGLIERHCPKVAATLSNPDLHDGTMATVYAFRIINGWVEGPRRGMFWHVPTENAKIDKFREHIAKAVAVYHTMHPELHIAMNREYFAEVQKRLPWNPEIEDGSPRPREWDYTRDEWHVAEIMRTLEFHFAGQYLDPAINDGSLAIRPTRSSRYGPNPDPFLERVKQLTPLKSGTYHKSGDHWRKINVCDATRELWHDETGKYVNSVPYGGSDFGNLLESVFSVLTGQANEPVNVCRAMDNWRMTYGKDAD